MRKETLERLMIGDSDEIARAIDWDPFDLFAKICEAYDRERESVA